MALRHLSAVTAPQMRLSSHSLGTRWAPARPLSQPLPSPRCLCQRLPLQPRGRRHTATTAAAAASFPLEDTPPNPPRGPRLSGSASAVVPPVVASLPLLGPLVVSLTAYVERVSGMWRRFLPMLSLFFFLSFINTILDSLKDTLVITAAGGGASVIPFLSVYAVLPCSLMFLVAYSWASQRMSRAALFNVIVTLFGAFFATFALFLMPNADALHLHAFADGLQQVLPAGLAGAIGMVRNWTYTLFFCASELWGDVCMGLLFWGLANDTTSLADAPTLYPLFGLGANVAQATAGVVLKTTTSARHSGAGSFCQEVQMALAVVLGMAVVAMGVHHGITLSQPRPDHQADLPPRPGHRHGAAVSSAPADPKRSRTLDEHHRDASAATAAAASVVQFDFMLRAERLERAGASSSSSSSSSTSTNTSSGCIGGLSSSEFSCGSGGSSIRGGNTMHAGFDSHSGHMGAAGNSLIGQGNSTRPGVVNAHHEHHHNSQQEHHYQHERQQHPHEHNHYISDHQQQQWQQIQQQEEERLVQEAETAAAGAAAAAASIASASATSAAAPEHSSHVSRRQPEGNEGPEDAKPSLRESFMILANSLEIRCLAVMSLAQGLCTSLMEFAWKSHMRLLYPSPSDFTAFLGDVATWTGVVTASLMLASPILFDKLGWRGVASATPQILVYGGSAFFGACIAYQHFFGAAAASAVASGGAGPAAGTWLLTLLVMGGALLYVFGKAAKFSLFKPAEEMVYITLDEHSRTSGKAAIDVVGSQTGKSGGSILQQLLLVLSAGAIHGPILPILFCCFFVMLKGWKGAVRDLSSRRRYTLNSPMHSVEEDSDWPEPSAGNMVIVAAPPRPAQVAARLEAADVAARLRELQRQEGAGSVTAGDQS